MLELRLGQGRQSRACKRWNLAGNKALVLSNLAATLAEGAELSTLNASTLGGETSRHQVFVTYQGEHAKADNPVAQRCSRATSIMTRRWWSTHAVPHGVSRELFRTVVDGAARGIFRARSSSARTRRKPTGRWRPTPCCYSRRGRHEQQAGTRDFRRRCRPGAWRDLRRTRRQSAFFYLMARGLPRAEAEALLVEAFIGGGVRVGE